MAPPPAATGVTARRHGSAAVAPSRRREAARPRHALRIVPPRPRRGRGTGATGRPVQNHGRVLIIMSVSLVVAALLAVVVAQAFLANGQVRLSALQHQLSLEQSAHRQSELSVSGLETPARIVGVATSQLHMVRPAVVELPYVSLQTPLPTPKVTPAPAAAAAQGAGSAGSAGSTGSAASAASTSAPGTSGTSSTTASAASGSSTSGTSTTTATSTP